MSEVAQRNGVLVIGDSRSFCQAVRTALDPHPLLTGPVRETTYESCRSLLSPRIFREVALFVLELWRNYPTGGRAEGLVVAEQLLRLGALPLVVSPLALGQSVRAPFYWDIGSIETLEERCVRLLTKKRVGSAENDEALAQLKEVFRESLSKPIGHEDRSPNGPA